MPGLTFRHITGEADAELLHAVHIGRAARDGVDLLSSSESFPSLEGLRARLVAEVAAGHQDRWLVAEVAGQTVGYNCLDDWPEADGTHVYLTLGWVLPRWRGRGIGTALLRWSEGRIRRLAMEQGRDRCAELAGNASSTETEAAALLRSRGYYVAYNVVELGLEPGVTVPGYALPDGVELRPVLPEHLLPIAECIGEAYANEYPGDRFATAYDPAEFAPQLAGPEHDPTLWQVAWAGNLVVGQALAQAKDGRAELFEFSVHPAWRRRGLGRALLSALVAGQRERFGGATPIRVRTVAEFPTRAIALYRAAGFRELKRFPRYRKPFGVQPWRWSRDGRKACGSDSGA